MKANPDKIHFMVFSPIASDKIELKLGENAILKSEMAVRLWAPIQYKDDILPV